VDWHDLHPARKAIFAASKASDTEPIWFELEQKGVAGTHLDALLQAVYVGDVQVVSYYYCARQLGC